VFLCHCRPVDRTGRAAVTVGRAEPAIVADVSAHFSSGKMRHRLSRG
jgi:hypothetical protein